MDTVTLCIRLDATDEGELVWWADSDDVPGLYVAAGSLDELIIRGQIAVVDIVGAGVVVEPLLAPGGSGSEGEPLTVEVIGTDSLPPSSVGPAVRTTSTQRDKIPA